MVPCGAGVLVGGGVFGFVLLGFVLFGLVVFGLVPLGFVWLGVPLGFCPFGFSLVPLGLVVPGLPVSGFVVPDVPVLGLVGVAPGFVVPGVCPVGGFTEPVGGGGGVVAPGVRDWPLCPAVPVAVPPVAEPPGAACAIIHVAHSKTTESKVRFLIDMMEASRTIRDVDPQRGLSLPGSVSAERRREYPADALETLLRKGRRRGHELV